MSRFPVNNAPYYDDFSEDKHFLKIMYKPGVAVQARELNQAQTIIQNQVERFGRHIFTEGSLVVPGNIVLDYNVAYINVTRSTAVLMSTTQEIEDNWIGKNITCSVGNSAGITALVFDYSIPTDLQNTVTLFVKYISSNSITETRTVSSTTANQMTLATVGSNTAYYASGYVNFTSSITSYFKRITAYDNSSKTLTLDSSWTGSVTTLSLYPTNMGAAATFSNSDAIFVSSATSTSATILASSGTGVATIASVNQGIYFTHGMFCRVEDQTIIVDPATVQPSCRIGLTVVESIIDVTDDSSLYDNSLGTENTAAPGADRLNVELTLVKLDLDTIGTIDEEDFIELMRLENGVITKKVNNSTYAELNKTLARRTYDESGDYTVRPFLLDVKQFFDESTTGGTGEVNGGVYDLADFDYNTEAEAEAASLAVFERKNALTGEPEAAAYASGNKWRPGADQTDLLSLCRSRMAIVLDPGKAYVKGYEIETISKTYLSIPKALEYKYTATSINCGIGNYIKVCNVFCNPDIATHASVTLYSAYNVTPGTAPSGTIGTASVASFEYDSGAVGTPQAVYKMYLFNIKMFGTSVFEDVKSFSGQNSTAVFTADIFNNLVMDGTITHTAGASITGTNTQWLTATDPAKRLYPGDVLVSQASSGGKNELVIAAIINDGLATSITSSYSATNVNYTKKLGGATLHDTDRAIPLFELPHTVKALKDEYGKLQSEYIARVPFKSTRVNNSGKASISLLTNSEFVDYSSDAYSAFVVSVTGGGTLTAGSTTDLENIITFSEENKALTIAFPQASLTNALIDVIANVKKMGYTGYGSVPTEGSKPKTKTLTSYITTTADGDKNLGTISLGKCDIKRITQIYMSDDFSSLTFGDNSDITDRYTLDDGQRDTHYDIGKLTLKPTAAAPTGRLQIEFEYYEHAAPGGQECLNYFCRDSYVDSGQDQEYTSKELGYTYKLNDCIDFRPRIGEDGTFSGTNSLYTQYPIGNFYTEYSYYLNRIDKVYLDPDGDFHITQGISAEIPTEPDSPTNGMVLYNLNVVADTSETTDVIADFVENKRFTMRDIGKLERRIENLEYYTNLNQLENNIVAMKILDSEGNDRYKNGFVADNFSSGGKLCDTENSDLKCSIDFNLADASAQTCQNNIKLIEKDSDTQTDATRAAAGYQITGNLITLPYNEVVMIDQPVASHYISVNPFNTISFYGYVYLTPDKDTWKDTVRAPDLKVTNDDGSYDTIAAALKNSQGTIYGEWRNIGKPTVDKGKPRVISDTLERGNNPPNNIHGAKWPTRHVVKKKVTKTISQQQTRTKREPIITTKTVETNLGDKVIDISYIPYMRSSLIQFSAKGLKPGVKVTPFFDDINVETFCYGTNFIPDSAGKLDGFFVVPGELASTFASKFGLPAGKLSDAEKAIRIKTGIRQFVLTDDTKNGSDWTSKAQAAFFAEGLREVKQNTIMSTRTPQLSYIDSEEQRVKTSTTSIVTTTTGPWQDPLAETFMVTKAGGAFITSIDLYFAGKDENLPVSVQIREVVNGYPGQKVLPYSLTFLDPASVTTSADASEKTTFTFESPVYLMENTEYCFVVMSNSDKYTLWIATMGINPATGLNYTQIGTDIPVQQNPYTGVFFKSQNASTWTADQYSDIKFTINCAEFTSATGTVEFTNDEVPVRLLDSDPIQTAAGSGKIRILHENHGMSYDALTPRVSYVTLSGVSANVNGVSMTHINGTHTISDVDLDSYTIDLETEFPATAANPFVKLSGTVGASPSLTALVITGGATTANYYQGMSLRITGGDGIGQIRTINSYSGSITTAYIDTLTTAVSTTSTFKVYPCTTGFGGGSEVTATENYQMDVMNPCVAQLTFPQAQATWTANVTTGKSVDGTEQPYTLQPEMSIYVNQDNVLTEQMCVASTVNEQSSSMYVGGVNTKTKSLVVKARLSTTNTNISPAIDMNELSVIAVGHRVDNPTEVTRSVAQIDTFEISETPMYGYAFDPANSMIMLPAYGTASQTGNIRSSVTSASTSSVTLSPTASTVDNAYVGLNLYHAASTTVRTIIAYTGSTQVATLSGPVSPNTDEGGYILGVPTSKQAFFEALREGDIISTATASNAENNKQYIVSAVSTTGTANYKTVYINVKNAPTVTEYYGAARMYKPTKFKSEEVAHDNSASSRYIMQRFALDTPSTAAKIVVSVNRLEGSTVKTYYRTRRVGDITVFDDVPWIEAVLETEVTPSQDWTTFKDYEYTINDLQPFTMMQVKVVMLGDDTANPPRLKDVRVIALDL